MTTNDLVISSEILPTMRVECPASRVVFEIRPDGSVWVAPDLDLSAVSAMELPYLKALREIVNTAVYDKEREVR